MRVGLLTGGGDCPGLNAVIRAAVRVGMEFGAMHIFHMKNNESLGCRHLFSMANLFHPGEFNLAKLDQMAIHGLTLFMSVPGVQNPIRVFDKMTETAKAVCEISRQQRDGGSANNLPPSDK